MFRFAQHDNQVEISDSPYQACLLPL